MKKLYIFNSTFKKVIQKGLSISLLVLCIHSISAQREADNVLTFDNKVEDLIIVPFNGIAVVSDGKNLHGYDPNDDKIIWTSPSPKLIGVTGATNAIINSDLSAESILNLGAGGKGSGFNEIPDTPFLQKFFDNKLYIINSFNGEYIFETKDEKTFFFQSEYLFEEDALLLRGIEGKKLIISKYDLKTKEYVWQTVVSENFASALSQFAAVIGDDPTAGRDEMIVVNDKIFILAKAKFFALNKNEGTLLWKAEEKSYINFYSNQDASNILLSESKGIFSSKELLDLRNANDGKPIWKNVIKTKRLILFEDWEDKMLLAHYKGFNFYDYKTGEKRWKKDPKGKNIKSVIPEGTDFIYVYDDEMMLIDKDGQKKWKKDVNICDDEEDPIFFLEKTKNGKILYVTATYANLVDYNTGKKLWKRNLKLNEKRPTFAKFDQNTNDFVIYNDEELYRFNENTTERPEPYAKLKLKSEKTISSMEIFQNNVSISGQSEVVGVDTSGNVLFHNKYSQPGEFGRKLLKKGIAVGTFASAVATTKIEVYSQSRDAKGNIRQQKVGEIGFGEKAQKIGKAGYVVGNFSKQFVSDRYNALQETDKYAILFVKGENKEKLIVRIDKETGKEIDKIIVENNKPVYDYDMVTKDMYYSKGKEVKIFRAE